MGNLAPAPPASKPSGIIKQEQSFQLARKEPALNQLTEDDLKKVLRYVFALVGIRAQNMPAAEEKQFLHAYIFQHYGTHTPAEIRLAFDMAIQGQLDLEPSEVKCYENFSPIYFATIMRAYRSWAAEQARRQETQPDPPPTQEQLDKIDQEYKDYLIWVAYVNQQRVDKLPSTIQRLKQWQRENSKTK